MKREGMRAPVNGLPGRHLLKRNRRRRASTWQPGGLRTLYHTSRLSFKLRQHKDFFVLQAPGGQCEEGVNFITG
jgi:hypothetical protein